LVYTNQTR